MDDFRHNSLEYLICMAFHGLDSTMRGEDIDYVKSWLDKPKSSKDGAEAIIRQALHTIEEKISEHIPNDLAHKKPEDESQVVTLESTIIQSIKNPYDRVVTAALAMREERVLGHKTDYRERLQALKEAIIQIADMRGIDMEELELFMEEDHDNKEAVPTSGQTEPRLLQ